MGLRHGMFVTYCVPAGHVQCSTRTLSYKQSESNPVKKCNAEAVIMSIAVSLPSRADE